MTELQWLIKMLTQEKLPTKIKDMFIERIGEVEASLSKPKAQGPVIQPPSTQRILEQGPPLVGPIPTPKGAVVDNGDGTFGKRKW